MTCPTHAEPQPCPECQYLAAERAAIQLEHLVRTGRP